MRISIRPIRHCSISRMTTTSPAMFGSMSMAMRVIAISRIVATLSLARILCRQRTGPCPRTTTSEVHSHLVNRQLICLHRSSDDESVSSDMFVMSPEQPKEDEPFSGNKDGSVASSETAVQDTAGLKTTRNQAAMRLRSLVSRHVLVKDTAFRT